MVTNHVVWVSFPVAMIKNTLTKVPYGRMVYLVPNSRLCSFWRARQELEAASHTHSQEQWRIKTWDYSAAISTLKQSKIPCLRNGTTHMVFPLQPGQSRQCLTDMLIGQPNLDNTPLRPIPKWFETLSGWQLTLAILTINWLDLESLRR